MSCVDSESSGRSIDKMASMATKISRTAIFKQVNLGTIETGKKLIRTNEIC